MIDTTTPDGQMLERLYNQLRVQQKRCEALDARFRGDCPLPVITDTQRDAIKFFVRKSRTNFERVIVDAVLNRLRIVGIATAKGAGEGGDAQAYATWKRLRGKLWTREVHRMALSMSLAYVIVGKDADGNLIVTSEDPRFVTAITDPANPYKVLAGLKLFHDDVADEDVAYLYLPGRVMVAKRARKVSARQAMYSKFNPQQFDWDLDVLDGTVGDLVKQGLSGPIRELAELDDNGEVLGGLLPIVPFVNDTGRAQFEDFTDHIDRIHQQVLQRMTIATIQAFKQRAFKGLPRKDPDTGEVIDWNKVFTADPGAIWALPEGIEIWESGQADLTGILAGIRDDIKDLYAVSGVPGYRASPDAANASAESASLQREQNIDNVETCQDVFEPSWDLVLELIFKYLEDGARSEPGTVNVLWAPAERLSMTEKANAVAQTRGVVSRRQQLIQIMQMSPSVADQTLTELRDDFLLDQQYAIGLKAATGATTNVTNVNA